MKNNEAVVGMGATGGCGSDCYPYTITKILSPCRIEVQADLYSPGALHEGPYGQQHYEYRANPNGPTSIYTKRRNGGWYEQGCSMKYGALCLGTRRAYFDPSF